MVFWITFLPFFLISVNGASGLLVSGMILFDGHRLVLTCEHEEIHLVFNHLKKRGLNGPKGGTHDVDKMVLSTNITAQFFASPNNVSDHKFHLSSFTPQTTVEAKPNSETPNTLSSVLKLPLLSNQDCRKLSLNPSHNDSRYPLHIPFTLLLI